MPPDDENDKSAEWLARHPNPSGLEDGHPAKVAQPVADHHHEEGHECNCPVPE
jgi:hypothetical protein